MPKRWTTCFQVTTPENVQRWTVPSCWQCNNDLSKIEKRLLVGLGLCLDPHLEGASGIGKLALRSLGIDADDISEKEKSHRTKSIRVGQLVQHGDGHNDFFKQNWKDADVSD
jgi:hypothetical protein